ncbi:uncharacterized protein LOC105436991 [Strongylocentrotus purpuratus]|uniref:NACHT domain-containing protein n=1 Tax=Strongylocentrotus purpuratus TaxID=7668 RepID=A0A7M7T0V1_STRPU|nr:uncharacterized protein LOC105436991 [Strongylocentrotus purpuratus]
MLESYKPFLNWSGESSWRSTCLVIIIVCSSLAYSVLSYMYVIKNNADIQDSLVLIGDENAKGESTTKVYNTTTGTTIRSNNSPTESNIKEKNTRSESTIKELNLTKSAIKVNNTQTESIIENNNNTLTESRFKEKNATTESTKECNNIPTNATIKKKNTSDYMTDKPSKRKPSKRNPSRRKPSKRNPSRRKPSKRNPSRRKPSKRKTTKKKMTATESAYKSNNTITETTIKANNSPSESIITDSNTPNGSAIKCNNSTSESTIKDTTNKSATKENNTLSRPPTEENSNQSMEVNIVQADYTIRSGFQKVLSDGKYISSRIPSSLKGTTEDPVVQESTCLPEMILVKAGDVEQNPGPFDRSADIQEKELLKLAHDVSPSKYTELCIELGESYSQSQGTLDRRLMNFADSLMEIFCKWKNKQRDGTDSRKCLAQALCDVDLETQGDKISRGGYLPQEAAPTDSLTTEQVTRCADDFKDFYRKQLCKIQTDPLDFSLVLEFDRIYTDLVLLRNERGAAKKTPLEYKELLKMKIHGELPKRLMVEGEGGAGKTTFCSKMAWDWTNEADEFREFDWVLVIPLRDIEGNQTVGDIAKTYLSDSNSVQPHQIDAYILANPLKVFIIFDGLDEYDGDLVKQENDIAKIIRSENFKECRVLVTTRPWKADQIKSNFIFMRTYAFIAVAGFDEKHISIYIEKYFSDDPQASKDLIKLLEGNDVIKDNMAYFPIYIAMLCILWQDSDSEKREIIRRLKTFSQLFEEIITMLKEHYVSKCSTELNEEIVTKHYKQLGLAFTKIGEIALSGVVDKKLGKAKCDFSSCKEAMETCCKVGVLSREKQLIPKRDRHKSKTPSVTENVFFPHKLFQEYLAGMYLASLFESDHKQYEKAMNDVIQRVKEFRYLLYFTACQSKKVAFDVTKRLIDIGHYKHILVDVTFEAYDEDAAKVVGKHLFAKETSLEIDDEMSAHTVSGYIFIMEKLTMETLILSRRSCGPTVSRDLADVICSSTALTALKFNGTALHDDFYGFLEGKVKTSKVERLSLISMEISEEHASRNLARFLNNLPRLKDLTLQDNRFDGGFYTELASGACSVEVEQLSLISMEISEEYASHNLARFLNNLPRLKDLTLQDNRFDGGFYTELASGACSVEVGLSCHSIRKLHLDHQSNNDILQYGITVDRLFPMLEHLYFATLQTVSPNILGSFAHSGLKELSFAAENRHGLTKEDEECHVPLIGDPSSLEQVFLNSFPLLTNLTFNNLVIGNNRCETILGSLKQHQHLENLCVVRCYTDEELDPIASAINKEKGMQVNIQHDQTQKRLECMKMSSGLVDALSHRTSIQELILTHETIFSNAWCSEENQRTMNLKIKFNHELV